MPNGMGQSRKRFALRWQMHQLHLFSNRDYRVLALTRCWSGGDSNRRSSFWFLALTKGSKFHRSHCAEGDQRIVLRAS